jgi:hypothetical protein
MADVGALYLLCAVLAANNETKENFFKHELAIFLTETLFASGKKHSF